jgi:hypothetical protein
MQLEWVTLMLFQLINRTINKENLICRLFLVLYIFLFTTSVSGSNKAVTIAIEKREQGYVQQSIYILNQALISDPNNLYIKMELASSYFMAGESSLAKKLAEDVISVESLPVIVRKNISNFIALIDKKGALPSADEYIRRHSVSLFSGYDSNATIAPSDSLIDIGELSDSSVKRAEYFSGLMYNFSQFKKVPLNNKKKNIATSLYHYTGLTLYNKNYSGLDSSDLLLLSARAGFKYTAEDQWYTKAKVELAHIELDHSSLVNYYNLSTQTGYQYGKSEVAIRLAAKLKDYYQATDRSKNGNDVKQTLLYQYHFPKKVIMELNASYTRSRLNDKSYSFDSIEYGASLKFPLRKNINLNISSSFSKNKYKDIQKHYENKRIDSTHRKQIKIDFLNVYNDVDAQLSYSYVDRESNHDINAYNRRLLMMTLKYRFGS